MCWGCREVVFYVIEVLEAVESVRYVLELLDVVLRGVRDAGRSSLRAAPYAGGDSLCIVGAGGHFSVCCRYWRLCSVCWRCWK